MFNPALIRELVKRESLEESANSISYFTLIFLDRRHMDSKILQRGWG